MNLATSHNPDRKETPSILGERDERELVLQVQEAVDVVLGSAAKQMGVDKSARKYSVNPSLRRPHQI